MSYTNFVPNGGTDMKSGVGLRQTGILSKPRKIGICP